MPSRRWAAYSSIVVIAGGGSVPLGAVGYAAMVGELDRSFDHIVVASGSGGTHAGILVGLHAAGLRPPVTGLSVGRRASAQAKLVGDLAEATAALLLLSGSLDSTIVDDRFVGDGYALPTETMTAAVRLVAATEGVLLDPVYTGKAMAGLIDLARGDEPVDQAAAGPPSDPSVRRANARPRRDLGSVIAAKLGWVEYTAPFKRGLDAARHWDYDKAIADFSQTIGLNLRFVAAWSNRGNAYAGLKQWDKAIADYSMAIKLDPKNAAAHNALAWLLANNPDPSEDEIRSALSSNLCRCTGYLQMYQAIHAAIDAEQKGVKEEQLATSR